MSDKTLNKRLLRKYAYVMAGSGGTCDEGDILDCMHSVGINASMQDARYVSEIAQGIWENLRDKGNGSARELIRISNRESEATK